MSSIARLCSIENCQKPYLALGYCSMHYSRYRKYGNTEYVAIHHEKTGLPRDSFKNAWINIKSRCLRPTHPNYKDYGGRGITICERWRTSYKAFYDDMSPRPEKHTIDRKDNDGNYSCGKCQECLDNGWLMNCRWITQGRQILNTRQRKNTSGYRGVTYYKGRWFARLTHTESSEQITLTFSNRKNPEEAAIDYDIAAIFFRGDEAKTNLL